MIWNILGAEYLLGYLWFWRYHVGFFFEMDRSSSWDGKPQKLGGFDVAFGLIMGTIISLVWPASVTARVIMILWARYGVGHDDALDRMFPGPKEIETREQRLARNERESREKIKARQKEVNAHERENGMTITKW